MVVAKIVGNTSFKINSLSLFLCVYLAWLLSSVGRVYNLGFSFSLFMNERKKRMVRV